MSPKFDQPAKEKKTLKILFWCIAPLLFVAFFRLFWLVFGFIYGGLLSVVVGSQFSGLIAVLSVATALIFTVLTIKYVYQQFKKHIIGE